MIQVAGRALARLARRARRTMTTHASFLGRYQHVGSELTRLRGDVAFAAARHRLVFRMTEMRVRQPAFNHDRLGSLSRWIRNAGGLFHLMTKSAASVLGATAGIVSLRAFVWVPGKKNTAL